MPAASPLSVLPPRSSYTVTSTCAMPDTVRSVADEEPRASATREPRPSRQDIHLRTPSVERSVGFGGAHDVHVVRGDDRPAPAPDCGLQSNRRPIGIGNRSRRSVLSGRRRGPGRGRSRHREAAGRRCANVAPHARPNTSAIASWRGRASPTTPATTPLRSRRPRASSRCSRTSRRRCCSEGTCSTRCTASARRRRSRAAWSRCGSSRSTSGSSAMC